MTTEWERVRAGILSAAASSGDSGALEVAMQLTGTLPCPGCGYVKYACRCKANVPCYKCQKFSEECQCEIDLAKYLEWLLEAALAEPHATPRLELAAGTALTALKTYRRQHESKKLKRKWRVRTYTVSYYFKLPGEPFEHRQYTSSRMGRILGVFAGETYPNYDLYNVTLTKDSP